MTWLTRFHTPSRSTLVETTRDRLHRWFPNGTDRLDHPEETDVSLRLGALAAVCLGFLVRAIHVLPTDFPLNDGGLFYLMVQELQRSHYRLPYFSSYNSAGIPYAYSPLAFYIAALLTEITPLTLLDVFRYLPLAVSTATIVAFFFLARAMLGSKTAVVAAVVTFALIPRTFIWLLMGGGLTRSFGFLFAILALHQIYMMYIRSEWRYALTGTVYSACTVLSHLGTVPFVVFSSLLMFLFYGRSARAVIASITVGLGTVVLTAPWWGYVVAVHGLEPFRAANATGMSIFSDRDARGAVIAWLSRLGVGSSTGGSTAEALFPLLGTLALLGALHSAAKKHFFLILWWIAIIIFEVRAGGTYAPVPVAMLAGIGITNGLLPLLGLPGMRDPVATEVCQGRGWSDMRRRSKAFFLQGAGHSGMAVLVLGFLLVYATVSATLKHKATPSDLKFLVSVSPEERDAMNFVRTTAPESRFLVMPEDPWIPWGADKPAEWFPVLAQRVSVGTIQGTEWLPDHLFYRLLQSRKHLVECDNGIASCLDEWSQDTGRTFTHVYIPQRTVSPNDAYLLCCKLLIRSLLSDSRYERIYNGPGAVIFARRS